MSHSINQRSAERNAKYEIQILDRFFDVRRVHHPVTLGTFGWSSTPIHLKWLHSAHAANYGGGYVTPGDLARDYLALKYPNRRIRCTSEQWNTCVAERKQPPIYCNPCRLANAVYLDIQGAFWQIVRAVGWDVEYLPGEKLYSKSRMTDFPYPTIKLARNCLVSVGIPAPMRLWTGTELKFIKKKSKFVNLILWRLVQDVLNSIAADMVDHAGAVYVYTDGYIIPAVNAAAGFDILNDWGITGAVKYSGDCDIVAPACYSFTGGSEGFRATENYKRRPNRRQKAIEKIYRTEREFLRKRFARYGHFAQKEWEGMKQ